MTNPNSGDTTSDAPPTLPTKSGGRRTAWLTAAIVAIVVVVGGGVFLANRSSGSTGKTVSIGVTDASQPYWRTFTTLAKDRLGITVKLVNFTDYSQPNPALAQKQLDINEFQHIQYLANYNASAHDDLQPIGATAVYPLPLYALKYKTVNALPAGAKVAIPNDAINEARGLLVLQSAGLLQLKGGGSAFSTAKDIQSHKVDVVTLDASQTANALHTGSVAAAIVNNDYATSAGLTKTDVLFKDNPNSESSAPYINVFVVRKSDAGNSLYQQLAAIYRDPQVEKEVQAANGGGAYFRPFTPSQLQSLLAKVTAQAKAAGA